MTNRINKTTTPDGGVEAGTGAEAYALEIAGHGHAGRSTSSSSGGLTAEMA